MDEQTRKELRRAYNDLQDMDIDRYPASLDAAVRFYQVARGALRSYPTSPLALRREEDMRGMLDRIATRLASIRSDTF